MYFLYKHPPRWKAREPILIFQSRWYFLVYLEYLVESFGDMSCEYSIQFEQEK